MSGFRLPLISPLAGTTFPNLVRVLKGHRVAPRYYFKMVVTVIVISISSLFQWMDRVVLGRKIKNYSIKKSPLFIIGHWRSGTTALHNILSKDPDAGIVSTYQAVFPNNLKSQWIFKTFMRIFMPAERPGDEMKISVDLPQEEEYALSNMTDRSFYHFFYFPSNYKDYYKEYVRFDKKDEDEKDIWKLEYRRLVILALLNSKGRRAVLKNPVNTGRIELLMDLFPDADFVFMIRNPIIVYLSTKKFFGQLFPTVNLEKFNQEDISRMILDIYEQMMKDYISDRNEVGAERIIEIRYEEFAKNPMAAVQDIYHKISPGDFEGARSALEAYMEGMKNYNGYNYSISRKELNMVLPRLDFAMKNWNYSLPSNLKIID